MKVSSESQQNAASVKHKIEDAVAVRQAEKGSENTQNVNSSPSQDTVEISGQAAKLAHAELREQAALARIQMLEQQNAAMTRSDEQAETGEEDPLSELTAIMLKMMEERQKIQLDNAAEQAERQKEEMSAAMLELEEARAEKKAAQEETAAASAENAGIVDSKARSSAPLSDAARKEQEQLGATYGKKGTPVRTGFSDSGAKGGYRVTV